MRDGLGGYCTAEGMTETVFLLKTRRDEGLEKEAIRIEGRCNLEQVLWKVARIKGKWHCCNSAAVVTPPLWISGYPKTSHRHSTVLTHGQASQPNKGWVADILGQSWE